LKEKREKKFDLEISGVFSGSYVSHPITGESIPVWISDYVLPDYGTGAIMGVPAHNKVDFMFAKKFMLKIKPVISKEKDVFETILNFRMRILAIL
jgi:leucyl-tRNA synthetase